MKETAKPERGKEEQQPARGGPPSQYSRASFRALPLMERNDPLKHRAGSGSWSYPSRKSSNLITVVLNFIAPFLVRESTAMSLMIYLFLYIYIIHSTEKIMIFHNLTLYNIPKLSVVLSFFQMSGMSSWYFSAIPSFNYLVHL